MDNVGYVKIYRKIWESKVLNDGDRFTRIDAWIWLLMHANYKETTAMIRGNAYKIQRGQMMASIRHLAEIWRWNPRTVMRYLSLLENDKMITKTRTSYATLITVCNYSKYQDYTPSDSEEYNDEHNAEYNTEYNAECNNLKNTKKDKKENKDTRGGRVIE